MMVGPAEAVTARLTCIRPGAVINDEYWRLFTEPGVEAWLRPRPMSRFARADIDRLVRHDRFHWTKYSFGPWVLRLRADGRFVGRGGLAWTVVQGERMVELPWVIVPGFQGRGLASEQAIAAIRTARQLGLKHVVSLALVENFASRRVMEKIGLIFRGEVEHVGLPHVLYELGN